MLSCLLAGICPNVQSIPVIVPLDFRGKGKEKTVLCKKSNTRHSRWPRSTISRSGMAFRRAWEMGERREKHPVPRILKLPPPSQTVAQNFVLVPYLSSSVLLNQEAVPKGHFQNTCRLLQIPHVKPARIQLPDTGISTGGPRRVSPSPLSKTSWLVEDDKYVTNTGLGQNKQPQRVVKRPDRLGLKPQFCHFLVG